MTIQETQLALDNGATIRMQTWKTGETGSHIKHCASLYDAAVFAVMYEHENVTAECCYSNIHIGDLLRYFEQESDKANAEYMASYQ
jgi:hypothetical protein